MDLVVQFESRRSLLHHSALWLQLWKLLSYKVDVASNGIIKLLLRDRVLKEALPL